MAPHSYEFTTSDGSTVRRNQSSVKRLPGTPQNDQREEEESTRDSAERNSEPANEQDKSASETSDVSAIPMELLRKGGVTLNSCVFTLCFCVVGPILPEY